ncbi:MAG: tetratricopeptide repeat protein [Candidatus Sericytochromatia bacterium]
MNKLWTTGITFALLAMALPLNAASLNFEARSDYPDHLGDAGRRNWASLKTENAVLQAALNEVGEMPVLRSHHLTQYELEGLLLRSSQLSFKQPDTAQLAALLRLNTDQINLYFKQANLDSPLLQAFATLRQKQEDIRKKLETLTDRTEEPQLNQQYQVLQVFEQGLRAYDLKDWKLAEERFSLALKTDKKLVAAYNNRGRARIMLSDLNGALQDFKQVLWLDPRNAAALFNRGYVLSLKNQPELALESFNQAIALDRDNALYYNNRGTVHNALGQNKLALEDFQRATELNNQESSYFRNRAKTWIYLNNQANALEDYHTCLRLSPRNVTYYLERGQLRANMKDLYGALEDFTKALFIEPDNSDALYLRGQIYAQLNVRHLALSDYNRAIKLSPDSPYFERRGVAHSVELDQKKRLADYNVLIQRHPKVAEYYFERGAAYLYLRRPAQALADFERGLRLATAAKKTAAHHFFYRGLALRELNRCEAAMADFKRACDLELKEACEHGCGPQPYAAGTVAGSNRKAQNQETPPPKSDAKSEDLDSEETDEELED